MAGSHSICFQLFKVPCASQEAIQALKVMLSAWRLLQPCHNKTTACCHCPAGHRALMAAFRAKRSTFRSDSWSLSRWQSGVLRAHKIYQAPYNFMICIYIYIYTLFAFRWNAQLRLTLQQKRCYPSCKCKYIVFVLIVFLDICKCEHNSRGSNENGLNFTWNSSQKEREM